MDAPRATRPTGFLPPSASPLRSEKIEEAASRAVVRYLRHSKPGPGGWVSHHDIVAEVPEALHGEALVWLTRNSISLNHGPRLQARQEGKPSTVAHPRGRGHTS